MCTEALGLIVCCACEKSVGPRAVLHGFRDSFGGRSKRLKLFFGGDDSSSWRPRPKSMSEEHVPNGLQVMSPNATATQETLRGNVEANHESVGGLVTAEFWNPSGNSKPFELWWCRGDSGAGECANE